ncbi:MAG: hypothetical protein H6910_04120 [Rickettsiaceae bacterium]|nr:hypothetical protein [Rickettsiaceae bacterium]MCP5378282.1 hypothetical protein [Rickettsiaceae bacterium]
MYNPIKTITSVLIISTFKFVLVFGNSEIVLARSRFASNYSCSDTGKVYRKWCIKTNGRKRRSSGDSKRNTGGSAMIAILRLTVFCVFCLSVSSKVIATSYRDPTSKTNVNVQTDLFRKSVGDVEVFKSQVQEEEREAIEKLRSDGDHGVEFISGTSRKEIDKNTAELSTIKADELNDRGSTQLLREKLLEEIYVDESNPLMVAHRKDAERIAEGSKDLLGSLLLSLKERLGVNCYTVKGNKEIEPEHRIALKEEQIRETIYDQTMCEELRNRYSCHDSLTVRCNKRKINWGAWQNRIIEFEGSDVFYNHRGWTKSEYYRRVHVSSRGWISMTRIDFNFESSAVLISIGDEIARKLGVLREQITDVEVPVVYEPVLGINWQNPYHGAWFFIEGNTQVFKIIRLHYKFRTREEICAEWVDEWDEVCGLES